MNHDSNPTPEDPAAGEGILDAIPELYGLAERDDSKTLKRALVVALLFHLVLLIVHVPDLFGDRELLKPEPGKVYVVQTVRFQPPAPRRAETAPKPKAKKIPIPDPTPDEPEPVEVDEIEVPDVEVPTLDDLVFGIPDAPPGLSGGPQNGPLQVGGGVTAPERIYDPQPKYSEEARKARIQGAVILQAVIDALGNVQDVTVLKGLSMGLTESAIDTVKEWRFKPATLNGEPVAVYYNLIVTFSVQ